MKFFPIVLLAFSLLTGCATKPVIPALPQAVRYIPPNAVIPGFWLELGAYFSTGASNHAPDRPTDNGYFCPTPIQIGEMMRGVKPKLHRSYIAEAWDCDDMAWEWRVCCHRWAVENITKGDELPIAVFVCYGEVKAEAFDGRLKMAGLHALGLLCDASGVWWYVEPRLDYLVKVEEARLEGSIICHKIVW